MDRLVRRAMRLAKKNYLLSFFILVVCFVGLVIVYKVFFSRSTYVYAKVQVGQGYWWASTQRPSRWFVDSIRQAKQEVDLSGRPIVEVQNVIFYPWYTSSQYDVYLTARLKVSKISGTGKYSFKRSTIGIGSPIDFEFNDVQFSGIIIALSDKPFTNKYVTRTVTLTERGAYPWEYDSLPVGDTFNNGETDTLAILDKSTIPVGTLYVDTYGGVLPLTQETRNFITVKVKLQGKMDDGVFYYGETERLTPGRTFTTSSNGFAFNDYTISKVE